MPWGKFFQQHEHKRDRAPAVAPGPEALGPGVKSNRRSKQNQLNTRNNHFHDERKGQTSTRIGPGFPPAA